MIVNTNLILGVSKFVLTNKGNLAYLKGNDFMIDSKRIKYFESPFGDIYVKDVYIIWQDYLGYFEIFDLKANLITTREGYFNYLIQNNIGFYYFNAKEQVLKEIQLESDKQFKGITSNGNIYKSYFFSQQSKFVTVYSLIDNALLWQYNLPETVYNYKDTLGKEISAEIIRIIGVYGGVLWVVLNSGHLIGLSETTGELVAELNNIQYINFKPTQNELIRHYINEKQNINEFGKYLQLDAEKGLLFGLYSKFYCEIDLNAVLKNLQIYDISDTCDEFQITPKMPGYEKAWEGDEIFFGQIDTQANTVGIFNRKQKEITWAARVGQVVDWRPIVQKIDYAAGRLYVLDGENTLHVFENKQS